MDQMISVRSGGTEYLADPQIVYNLNLGHLLVTFNTIQMTHCNTAFSVYIPANKELVLIAGHKGFTIKSFKDFQLTMKQQINMDIPITTKETNQILIVDGQDNLRFARVDEKILLYSKATPYAHLFKYIFDQIVRREKEILEKFSQMRDFSITIPNTRQKRNVMELLLGRSTGM